METCICTIAAPFHEKKNNTTTDFNLFFQLNGRQKCTIIFIASLIDSQASSQRGYISIMAKQYNHGISIFPCQTKMNVFFDKVFL
jgi:hypothetical protein